MGEIAIHHTWSLHLLASAPATTFSALFLSGSDDDDESLFHPSIFHLVLTQTVPQAQDSTLQVQAKTSRKTRQDVFKS
ncbi:hypothetical protein DFH09DRAFT_1304649 [Mycena vulgaris]|nr:hypothetical protein DFH09DRAFT_1304649 [Mycena vulgaris]